jgi:hypothetical protein
MRPLLLFAFLIFVPFAFAQKQLAHSPRIVNAKTVYFQNTTGSESVGSEALAALKKWGKYQVAADKSKADLVFLLSADPYKGGNIEYSGGQTGSIDMNGAAAKTRRLKESFLLLLITENDTHAAVESASPVSVPSSCDRISRSVRINSSRDTWLFLNCNRNRNASFSGS